MNQKTEQELFNYQETILNGQIAIGCVEAENSYLLTQIIEEMVTDHPKCLLLFLAELVMIFWKNLIKGLLDVAILIDPATTDQYNRLTIA